MRTALALLLPTLLLAGLPLGDAVGVNRHKDAQGGGFDGSDPCRSCPDKWQGGQVRIYKCSAPEQPEQMNADVWYYFSYRTLDQWGRLIKCNYKAETKCK